MPVAQKIGGQWIDHQIKRGHRKSACDDAEAHLADVGVQHHPGSRNHKGNAEQRGREHRRVGIGAERISRYDANGFGEESDPRRDQSGDLTADRDGCGKRQKHRSGPRHIGWRAALNQMAAYSTDPEEQVSGP